MSETVASNTVKTRILIISDTHGSKPKPKLDNSPSTEDELSHEDVIWVPTGWREPLPEADVVLHCGDLTKRTTIPEYEDTFSVLRSLRAPLKLVIAGNHDMALHEQYWLRERGGPKSTAERAREIVEAAEADGVQYLDEGIHEFTLVNGARLRVYASQWTPDYGGWAFQYDNGHDFKIPTDVHVAMTHGPPQGICDFAGMTGSHAGCPDLLEAVTRAKPMIHCFGHIHEAWGTLLAEWNENGTGYERVREVGLKGLRPNRVTQNEETAKTTRVKLVEMSQQRAAHLDLTQGDSLVVPGERTLFVNAAIMDIRYRPIQLPWLVDVDLPRAAGESTKD
ncbi:hypothetical protein FZEAL_5462 [Fusarium zealandicum]|uniref:Calcineurin-like phosphoesterase domain-containing protein n=1 Tax=Fusarium zealandicum TaxID=1053134 RepID=A0A8H4UK37_9HYPO|nr:hypothetical protein FZEAL_5462 [Fusarium zealandicum]